MTMRVLLTSPAGFGHIHPMIPLARALAARGHDVLWALPSRGGETVEAAGLRAVAAGTKQPIYPADVMQQFPELAAMPPHDRPEVMFGKLFGAMTAPAFLDDLVPIANDFRPDLLVADAAEFAGHIVAAERGIPSVTKGFGALLPSSRVARAGDEVASLWRSRGLEPRPFGGSYDHLYLDIYPPELQAADASHVERREWLRPIADAGTIDPAQVRLPEEPAGAPLLYVTLGTVFNDVAPLRVVVDGLSGLDVRAIVTVGPRGDPAALGDPPGNVVVERYVPQSAVLPRVAAVISHAGSGTMLATLAEGHPQLCVPQGADQFLNAAAVVASGAGLSLPPDRLTAAAVRDNVSRLLAEPAFRAAAARVRDSIAAMPSPDDVAALLESLT